MSLLEKQLERKASNIPGAGDGLFTRDFIPKKTIILEYKGRIRTWKDAKEDSANLYIFYVTRNHVIDAGRLKNSLGRYVNDAKGLRKIKGLNNNAEFVRKGHQIFIHAVKDIPAGGEILAGYGKEYWKVIRDNLRIDQKQKALEKKTMRQ